MYSKYNYLFFQLKNLIQR